MNKFQTLMSILLAPFQDVENALIQLLNQRGVDTAVGAQLDVLGRVVGQLRGGLDDDTYRRYIRARVAANRSDGKREDVVRVCQLVLVDLTAAEIKVHREGTATLVVFIDGVAITGEIATALITFLEAAVSNGVRIILRYSISPPASVFRLDSGPGLDVGHLAGDLE
jgi:Protein of unknown function (DUF2612)